MDVVAHPFQSGVLVEIAVVAGVAALLRRQLRVRHESEEADPIVEVHEDRAAAGHGLAVVVGHAGRTDGASPAVYEHEDRVVVAGRGVRRRPDVEVEAVLAGRLLAEIVVDVVRPQHLDALGALAVGVPDPGPAEGLRRAPAQLPDGRFGEGNPQVGLDARRQPRPRQCAAGGGHRVSGHRLHGVCGPDRGKDGDQPRRQPRKAKPDAAAVCRRAFSLSQVLLRHRA